MTELVLVRHGETDWNLGRRIQGRTDIPMNDTGRAQAEAAAERLADEEWHAIVTSPLDRARETARIIAERLGLGELQVDDRLVERAYGEAEGMDDAALAIRFPSMAGVPGIERRSDVTRRVLPSLESIALEHPGQRVLVVTHGGVIGSLVRYVTEKALPPAEVRIPNGSDHRFRHVDGTLVLERFNGLAVEPPVRREAPITSSLTPSS
ncbi:probable phosphoglycerate mutase [Agreia bicolorata]|uniref:Probable phosphoglycerate mutase n=1 Tax=Agreia bicolorata TaxID=110935 RepID=A0A1T4X4E3_9MICO|nr:histidine phosphatase family protein [Agreia bicolorata]SKA84416.1 probable phosphoglycerate mutase [Agreia bicolorata]